MNKRITADLSAEARVEYQRCHALGHRWENIPVLRAPAFGSAIDLRCENCATVRRDILSRVSGQLITRYYLYPEDYHDYGKHDKAWWRAAFVESLREVAREYIDTTNESKPQPADLDARRVAREAKKAWIEALGRMVQSGPTRPSPAVAQGSRRNPPTEPATRQTRRVKRNAG